MGNAPPFTPGEDTLYASLDDAGMALAVRVHGLRGITAGLDTAVPSFELDTVANAIMNLTVAADGLEVAGRIDRLQPHMVFGVTTDEDGNVTGLAYSADNPSNSMFFDVEGLAAFTVFDPLPASFNLSADLASGSVIFAGSEEFTLQLSAEMEGDLFGTGTPITLKFDINTMRAKHFEFGMLSDLSPFADLTDLSALESPMALNLNTRHADGTLNTMGLPTRTLAAFNSGAATPTASGQLVIGIPAAALDPTLGLAAGDPAADLHPSGPGGRPDDLPSRWDAVVDDLGSGDRLGELSWAADEGLGLERAEQTLASWGLIELYRRDGEVVAVDLVGQMVSDADRTRFRADAIAAVAAVLDEEVDDATEVVDDELGFAAPDPSPSASAQHGGATIAVDRSATSGELRISRSKG